MSSVADLPDEAIVAIALTMDERTGYTLWAPPWEEDEEEWQAFLGVDGKILLFATPAQLAHYVAGDAEHDLSDHPSWADIAESEAAELVPDEDYMFDLDGIYELVGGGPDRWSVTELADVVDIVERMGECAETDDLTDSLAKITDRPLLELGPEVFTGRSGERAWTMVAQQFGEHWEGVLEALGGVVRWVDPVDLGEAEIDGDVVVVETDDVDAVPGLAVEEDEDVDPAEFWESVGILPVTLTVPAGTGTTLRCYLEDTARFLGHELNVDVFRSPEGLSSHIEDGADHDLTTLSTWGAVVEADADPVTAAEDSYDFVAVAELLAGDTDMWDPAPLAQAAEGALDLAEYCRLDRVGDLLGPRTELGAMVAEADRGVGRSLRPSPADRAAMSRQWAEIVTEISSCLRWHD